jgi:hypothetical protein
MVAADKGENVMLEAPATTAARRKDLGVMCAVFIKSLRIKSKFELHH